MSRRGLDRELRVRDLLNERGWVAFRTAKEVCDVIAFAALRRPMLIQVKSTAQGPYERFGPAERAALLDAARLARADAWLVWWPPRAKRMRWIASKDWP